MTADRQKSPKASKGSTASAEKRSPIKAIIVAGLVIVASFALFMGGNIYQIYFGGGEVHADTLELSVPAGLTVTHMTIDRYKLAVHFIGPKGAEIRIVDLTKQKSFTRTLKKPGWAILVKASFRGTSKGKLAIYTFVTEQECVESIPSVKRKHRLFFKDISCVSLAV